MGRCHLEDGGASARAQVEDVTRSAIEQVLERLQVRLG